MVPLRIPTIIAILTASLTLAACQQGIKIEVAGSPTEPTFTLARPLALGFANAAPGMLEVSQELEGKDQTVWLVRTKDVVKFRIPVSIQYGRRTPGMVEVVPPKPLVQGSIYSVSVSGGGLMGGSFFKIIDGKLVSVSGVGDEPLRKIETMSR